VNWSRRIHYMGESFDDQSIFSKSRFSFHGHCQIFSDNVDPTSLVQVVIHSRYISTSRVQTTGFIPFGFYTYPVLNTNPKSQQRCMYNLKEKVSSLLIIYFF